MKQKLFGNFVELFEANFVAKFASKTFFALIVIFSFLANITTYAQSLRLPYTFDQIKIGANSLENRILCMLKDRNGYLWLGTPSGLKRYDSSDIITLKSVKNDNKTLVNNFVEALCEDRQGRIWVGTTNGVCYFDKKKNSFYRFEELSKPDFACLNIICDSKGDVWFSIRDKGLYRFDAKTHKLINFSNDKNNSNSLTYNRITRSGLLEDPAKTGIWIACQNGMNFFDFATQKIYNQYYNPNNIPILTAENVSAFASNHDKFVYSNNTTKEICWYDFKSKKIIKKFEPKSTTSISFFDVYKIFFDNNDDIWLSSFNEKSAYINLKLNQTITFGYEKGSKTSFTANRFLDVFQEKNGTIWFATVNGISTINGMAALFPNEKLFDIFDFSKTIFNTKPNDGIFNILDDSKDSTWWIITLENRLINYSPSTNQFKEYRIPNSNKLESQNEIPVFIQEYQSKLFIFKQYNAFVFDKSFKKFTKFSLPDKISFKTSLRVSHTKIVGDSLWVFAENLNEAYNYDFVKKIWKTYPIIFNEKERKKAVKTGFSPSHSLITKNGDFWIAIHSGGLAKFDIKKQAFISTITKQDIDFSKIGYTGFSEDKNGKFWLGTYDLIKFDPKTNDFQTALEKDLIGAMVIDNNNNICMASLDEIMFFNEKTNEKYSFAFEVNETFDNWGNILVKLKNHKIISIYKHALALIDFKKMRLPSFNDQPYINKVTYDDTTILIHQNNYELDFKANRNSFAVHFGLLTPPNTSLYMFYYQLEGYNNDWVPLLTATNYAVFSNLDGGDYIFKVKAVDSNKKTLPIQSLNIHIDTYFYKSRWFYYLIIASIVFAAYSFYRYRLAEQKKFYHLREKAENLEKEKTIVQYESLKQHLNPHFLFNSLTSLRSLIKINPAQAATFLDGMSKVYRYVLKSGEQELTTLEVELDFAKTYIELQKTRFGDGLFVNIDVDEASLHKYIAPVTLQNLVENAIKHNTADVESPLIIDIYTENDFIIIKNNLQRYRIMETSNKRGLNNIKSLYKFYSEKELEIIDDGTNFIIKIPLI
jgi:ligand-binding sensor domain-containing protein/sensor histidine kinase YesM